AVGPLFHQARRQVTKPRSENGGTLEDAQQITAHASAKTTKLYDRRDTIGDNTIGDILGFTTLRDLGVGRQLTPLRSAGDFFFAMALHFRAVWCYSRGKRPWLSSSSRSSSRSGSFIARTATVALPTAVLPTTTGPSHRKCVAHLCRRGLKSFVSFFVFGS